MLYYHKKFLCSKVLIVLFVLNINLFSQIVNVGSGSYTTVLPAGKTAPPTTVYKTENLTKKVPTNHWYSSVLAMPYSSAHYGLPLSFKHTNNGLQIKLPVYEEKEDNVWGYFGNQGDF
jgi:endoglucanase Acf2